MCIYTCSHFLPSTSLSTHSPIHTSRKGADMLIEYFLSKVLPDLSVRNYSIWGSVSCPRALQQTAGDTDLSQFVPETPELNSGTDVTDRSHLQ